MPARDRGAHRAAPTIDVTWAGTSKGRNALGVTAREEAVAWARAAVVDPAVVYLDTETTGLDRLAEIVEIVEIAILDAGGRTLLDTLVRPIAPVPPVASAIHGVVDSDLEQAPTWRAIHQAVETALAGRRVIVYNAAFDSRMIDQSSARHGLTAPKPTWWCAMGAYASFRRVRSAGGSYRRHKLEEAASSFGGPVGGHRSAADARACRAVVVGIATTAG